MRRADRPFQAVQCLRGEQLTTPRQLADQLELSERTVYRDIQDLILSGVPIESEAGFGYMLRRGFDIPPLMFNHTSRHAAPLMLERGQGFIVEITDGDKFHYCGNLFYDLVKISIIRFKVQPQ